MSTDWKAFSESIDKDVLKELGSNIIISVPGESTRSASGKKIETKRTEYTGRAVRGKYDAEFAQKNGLTIKAGDVKFVAIFDDKTFIPTEKIDEKILFCGIKYTIINVMAIAPSDVNIVFLIQARQAD